MPWYGLLAESRAAYRTPSRAGSPFVVGLQLFASRVLYTMVESDNQVEFETSALSFTNPWHTKLGRELYAACAAHACT